MHCLEYKKEIYIRIYISRTLIELVGSYSESGEWLRKKHNGLEWVDVVRQIWPIQMPRIRKRLKAG